MVIQVMSETMFYSLNLFKNRFLKIKVIEVAVFKTFKSLLNLF